MFWAKAEEAQRVFNGLVYKTEALIKALPPGDRKTKMTEDFQHFYMEGAACIRGIDSIKLGALRNTIDQFQMKVEHNEKVIAGLAAAYREQTDEKNTDFQRAMAWRKKFGDSPKENVKRMIEKQVVAKGGALMSSATAELNFLNQNLDSLRRVRVTQLRGYRTEIVRQYAEILKSGKNNADLMQLSDEELQDLLENYSPDELNDSERMATLADTPEKVKTEKEQEMKGILGKVSGTYDVSLDDARKDWTVLTELLKFYRLTDKTQKKSEELQAAVEKVQGKINELEFQQEQTQTGKAEQAFIKDPNPETAQHLVRVVAAERTLRNGRKLPKVDGRETSLKALEDNAQKYLDASEARRNSAKEILACVKKKTVSNADLAEHQKALNEASKVYAEYLPSDPKARKVMIERQEQESSNLVVKVNAALEKQKAPFRMKVDKGHYDWELVDKGVAQRMNLAMQELGTTVKGIPGDEDPEAMKKCIDTPLTAANKPVSDLLRSLPGAQDRYLMPRLNGKEGMNKTLRDRHYEITWNNDKQALDLVNRTEVATRMAKGVRKEYEMMGDSQRVLRNTADAVRNASTPPKRGDVVAVSRKFVGDLERVSKKMKDPEWQDHLADLPAKEREEMQLYRRYVETALPQAEAAVQLVVEINPVTDKDAMGRLNHLWGELEKMPRTDAQLGREAEEQWNELTQRNLALATANVHSIDYHRKVFAGLKAERDFLGHNRGVLDRNKVEERLKSINASLRVAAGNAEKERKADAAIIAKHKEAQPAVDTAKRATEAAKIQWEQALQQKEPGKIEKARKQYVAGLATEAATIREQAEFLDKRKLNNDLTPYQVALRRLNWVLVELKDRRTMPERRAANVPDMTDASKAVETAIAGLAPQQWQALPLTERPKILEKTERVLRQANGELAFAASLGFDVQKPDDTGFRIYKALQTQRDTLKKAFESIATTEARAEQQAKEKLEKQLSTAGMMLYDTSDPRAIRYDSYREVQKGFSEAKQAVDAMRKNLVWMNDMKGVYVVLADQKQRVGVLPSGPNGEKFIAIRASETLEQMQDTILRALQQMRSQP